MLLEFPAQGCWSKQINRLILVKLRSTSKIKRLLISLNPDISSASCLYIFFSPVYTYSLLHHLKSTLSCPCSRLLGYPLLTPSACSTSRQLAGFTPLSHTTKVSATCKFTLLDICTSYLGGLNYPPTPCPAPSRGWFVSHGRWASSNGRILFTIPVDQPTLLQV